jgi:hypothetical protein
MPKTAHDHSDNEKFCNDLKGSKKLQNVRMAFESVSRSSDFQAEYEGSIPFTRSSLSIDLARGSDFIPTMGCLHLLMLAFQSTVSRVP